MQIFEVFSVTIAFKTDLQLINNFLTKKNTKDHTITFIVHKIKSTHLLI